MLYKCTNGYDPKAEGGIHWNDADIGIDWPVNIPILSDKDSSWPNLKDVPKDLLPRYKGSSGE